MCILFVAPFIFHRLLDSYDTISPRPVRTLVIIEFVPLVAKESPHLFQLSFVSKGTKVIELDEDDNEIASYPIIPQGESPEDAALRRQMLQYGLSEVGQVVAEIDLDAPNEEFSDEDMDDYDEDYDSDEDEDEDQYGRSTRREITSDYQQQMLELEKKLNARMMENVGPAPDADTLAEFSGDVRTLKVRKDEDFDKSVDKPASSDDASEKKKSVRFADDLDTSPLRRVLRSTISQASRCPYIRGSLSEYNADTLRDLPSDTCTDLLLSPSAVSESRSPPREQPLALQCLHSVA